MFLLQDALRKGLFAVFFPNGHDALGDDGTSVERFVDKVDSAAAPLGAVV